MIVLTLVFPVYTNVYIDLICIIFLGYALLNVIQGIHPKGALVIILFCIYKISDCIKSIEYLKLCYGFLYLAVLNSNNCRNNPRCSLQ